MGDTTGSGPPLSRRTVLGMAASAAALGVAACGRSNEGGSADSAALSDAATIARDAYIFGYPLVLLDVTRAAAEVTTPVNHFQHAEVLPTPETRTFIRPNLDTLYSTAWLDLRSEPMVLVVPPMAGGRYWLMQMLDAWTNSVHSPSSVRPLARSDSPPYGYVVTGPGWSGELPEELAPMPMPTPTVWLFGAIEVTGDDDIPAVHAIQQELKLVPLSAWIAGTTPPAPARPPARRADAKPPPEQVADMDPRAFFDRMCAVLADNPPVPDDAPAMRRFATIGIGPGGSVKGLADAELSAAVDTAVQQILVYVNADTVNVNGWAFDPNIGRYGTHYLLRATVARRGLGAAVPEEAVIFPTLFARADPSDGRDRFLLHFEPGQLPPVNAFWSLSAYGPDDYLVPNPAQIYSVGHHVPVAPNPDDSVDLILQYADPGPSVPAGNWLPIPPQGQFTLTLWMFAPKEEAVRLRWRPPALTPRP